MQSREITALRDPGHTNFAASALLAAAAAPQRKTHYSVLVVVIVASAAAISSKSADFARVKVAPAANNPRRGRVGEDQRGSIAR